MEPPGQFEVPLLARDGVELGHRLVDAPMLAGEHGLPLLRGQPRGEVVDPIRKISRHLERSLVAAVNVRVNEAREQLVEGVPRHPDAIQVEPRTPDLAGPHLLQGLPPTGDGRDVPVALGLLTGTEISHDGGRAFAEALIPGGGVRLGARREIVA